MLWILPIFSNVFTANILGIREKGRSFTHTPLDARVLHLSEPVPQYICIKLLKADDNDRAHRNDVNTLS